MESSHQFNLNGIASDCAVIKNASLTQKIATALAGGEGVYNFFSESQAALHQLQQTISSGLPSIWISGTSKLTGYPTWYVVKGNTMLLIDAYFTADGKQSLANGTGPDLQGIGFANLLLVLNTNQKTPDIYQVATYQLEYAGTGVSGIEVGEGLKKVIEKIVGSVKSYIEKIIEAIEENSVEASGVAEALTNKAENAAAQSSVKGEVIDTGTESITADITISVGEAVGAILTLGELAVTLTLAMLEKKMVAYAKVCNLTKQAIDISVCFVEHDSVLVSSPALPQTPVTLPGLSPSWTSPQIIGADPIHYIDLTFANTDTLKGIGYVIKAYPQGDFPGFNVMVNIPNHDDNSLYVSLGETDQCAAFWDSNKDRQKTLAMGTTSGNYTLKIATNQISGQSPSPSDGQLGYNYEHLIVIE